MTEPFRFVIAGRGRWATRMKGILAAEGRGIALLEETRRGLSEDPAAYHSRLQSAFSSSGAHIAWLCVPPGSHIPVMMQAAIEAGLHVVVEKPWLCSAEETRRLQEISSAKKLLLAIHYEYCLLEQVENWRQERHPGKGLRFGGRMRIERPDHIGLSALDNLGSHLFAIHEYSVADSVIEEMDCAYEQSDQRLVWLAKENTRIEEIDLLANKEPIIQRFIACVEAAVLGTEFPFGLDFALRVADSVALWRRSQSLRPNER